MGPRGYSQALPPGLPGNPAPLLYHQPVDSHAQGHLGSHVLKTQRRDQLESQQNKLLLS